MARNTTPFHITRTSGVHVVISTLFSLLRVDSESFVDGAQHVPHFVTIIAPAVATQRLRQIEVDTSEY